MPWAHNTHERMMTIYAELLEKLHSGEHRTIDITIQELLIRAEILKRDFTKRQLKIVTFIFTFSYAYGKEWAVIPKMKDFELAGISKIIVRKEIDQLINMNIIEWNQNENLFRIKDPREWGAPYHSGYSDERSRELFYLNLKHADIDVESILNTIKK